MIYEIQDKIFELIWSIKYLSKFGKHFEIVRVKVHLYDFQNSLATLYCTQPG